MRRIATLIFIVTFSVISIQSFCQSSGQKVIERYFKFDLEVALKTSELSGIISIDNVKEGEIYAYANSKQYAVFLDLNIEHELLPHPGTLLKNPRMLDYDEIRSTDDWDFYPTYDGYIQMMNQFANDYPGICDIVNIGTLNSGREILVAHIGDNLLTNSDEPEFFYTSTMHGDETAGYVLMLRLIDYLLSNYGVDDRVTDIVNEIDIWINPLANPDGTYAGGNHTVNGATRGNANGIDINRNFPDPEDGPHPDGNPWQEETIIFMDFAEAHDLDIAANLHGGAEVCNYPWDTWSHLTADNDWWYFVCREYADTAHVNSPPGYMTDLDNGVTNGYAWYTTSGNRQDYMNYFHQCREFTLEISSTKLVPANQLPSFWDYNWRSFLNYMEQSLYGLRGIVDDAFTGNPVVAEIYIEGHDEDSSWVYSRAGVGDYHRYLKSGTYTISYTAPGYHPQEHTMTVYDKNTTFKNVHLDPGDLIADFTASQTQISEGQMVHFIDQSFGNPDAWFWTFEGGNPETSALQSPEDVAYDTEGFYDVTLTIYKESDSVVLLKEDYIEVYIDYTMTNNTITACSGRFMDSGGLNDKYDNGEDYVMTFIPAEADSKIRVDFSEFEVEYEMNCDYDWLKIYDGNSISSQLIGKYCGSDSPGTIIATNAEGSLTFEFHSDASETRNGWIAFVSCDTGVGIVEPPSPVSLNVYPNPVASSFLMLESEYEIHTVELYTLDGRKVFNRKIGNNFYRIRTGDLKNGFYILKADVAGVQLTKKLFVISE